MWALYINNLCSKYINIRLMENPFLRVFSDKNSKRARDFHLLKQLKLLLKDQTAEIGLLHRSLALDFIHWWPYNLFKVREWSRQSNLE